jgi:signal transduction histidine kinase
MAAGEKILAAGGTAASDSTWLPASKSAVGANYQAEAAQSQSGGVFDYATEPVLGPNLYVLAQFSDSERGAARLRFLALALALALLVGLSLTFAGAARAELLRGVAAIKAAMPAKNAIRTYHLAPEGEGMPSELRELAAAYNEMARETESRERSLQASLAENQFLLRELNHRVKSSLQIIQSYVSLTRRLDRESGHHTSAAAIEARVLVLSAAYRKAFSEGRMRNVRIRQLAEEIITNLSRLFERPGVALELRANVVAALVIDHAIPLGLAMVESVIAGMNAEDARRVVLGIDQLEDLQVEMSVRADGALRAGEPNAKLMAGLALQLGAIVDVSEPGAVVHWRFQGLPPPVISAPSGTV